jgi:hypothetical protein
MLAQNVVAEIQRLLDLKTHSQRKIAILLGVSRGTVGSIASGRHRNSDASPGLHDNEPEEPTGPPARCPGCGGLVYMPCLLCRLRKQRPRGPRRNQANSLYVSGDLDLRPEHRQRYEEVRTRRRESADRLASTAP